MSEKFDKELAEDWDEFGSQFEDENAEDEESGHIEIGVSEKLEFGEE